MPDRCPNCDRPLATAEDREKGDVDGTVCWWGAIPGACGGVRVDWRTRCLEAEAEVATLRRQYTDADTAADTFARLWRESQVIVRCQCGHEYAWPTAVGVEEQVLRCRCGHEIRVRQAMPRAVAATEGQTIAEWVVTHYRTLDRVGMRGRKATCSCGWGHERGGWGPRGPADPRRSSYLAWLLQEAWRAHAGLPPCAGLLPDGYDYWRTDHA